MTSSGFADCSNVPPVGTDVLSFGGLFATGQRIVPSRSVGSRSSLEGLCGNGVDPFFQVAMVSPRI